MRLTASLIACWLFLVIGVFAQGTKSAIPPTPAVLPSALYSKAWFLIEHDYYDPKFNGQDWQCWKHRYDGKLKTLEDAHVAIATMLASLGDPKTKFCLRDDIDEDSANRHGRHLGFGMSLWTDRNNKVQIVKVAGGTPAFKAGIHVGDEVIAVDGKKIKGSNLEHIEEEMNGPVNAKVRLTIKRGSEVRELNLSKAALPLKSVATVTWLPGNLGYIGLDNLSSENAADELSQAVRQLHDCYGLILDLRKNPGGLLTSAVSAADLFLLSEKQCIVSTVDRDGFVGSRNASGKPITQQMLVLLIDKGTAEGAEILTAALRDNGRATVVGQTSYGGSARLVQSIYKLDDGSEVDASIARWLTPRRDEGHKGISPDIEVVLHKRDRLAGKGPWWLEAPKLDPEGLKDMQLLRAISFLRDKTSTQKTSGEKSSDGKTQSEHSSAEKPSAGDTVTETSDKKSSPGNSATETSTEKTPAEKP